MAGSAIALCTKALLKIGANSISSFDDGSTEGEVAGNLYPDVRDLLLSSFPWSFATAETRLNRLSATPVAGYQYAFQLPNDFLRVLSAGGTIQSRGLDYRIQESRLHTDSEEVILKYIFRPDPTAFPPFFDAVLVLNLAAELAIPITESTTKAEYFTQKGEREAQKARNLDSQQAPSEVINSNELIGCRGGM